MIECSFTILDLDKSTEEVLLFPVEKERAEICALAFQQHNSQAISNNGRMQMNRNILPVMYKKFILNGGCLARK